MDGIAVVMDNGSRWSKVGFSGKDKPSAVFSTITGRYRPQNVQSGLSKNSTFIGDEVQTRRDDLVLRYPVQNGVITDWDEIQRIWHHTFYHHLRVAPEDHPILLTEPVLSTRANRETMAQIMFEVFNTPAIYVTTSAVLSLHASNLTTGLVLDSGHGSTHAVPIYEGHVLPHAVKNFPVSGQDLTYYLMHLLDDRGYHFTASHTDLIRKVKEKFCRVAPVYDPDLLKTTSFISNIDYQLLDKSIDLRTEQFKCPETLFEPSFIGINSGNIVETIYDSILSCDCDIRDRLFNNIVLSGGNTIFPGLKQRLEIEFSNFVHPAVPLRIVAPENRHLSSWIGGAMMADLPEFSEMAVNKREYHEFGPNIVHRKCF